MSIPRSRASCTSQLHRRGVGLTSAMRRSAETRLPKADVHKLHSGHLIPCSEPVRGSSPPRRFMFTTSWAMVRSLHLDPMVLHSRLTS